MVSIFILSYFLVILILSFARAIVNDHHLPRVTFPVFDCRFTQFLVVIFYISDNLLPYVFTEFILFESLNITIGVDVSAFLEDCFALFRQLLVLVTSLESPISLVLLRIVSMIFVRHCVLRAYSYSLLLVYFLRNFSVYSCCILLEVNHQFNSFKACVDDYFYSTYSVVQTKVLGYFFNYLGVELYL